MKISRILYEVYETDEENYVPYEPLGGEGESEEEEVEESEEESEEDEGLEDLETDEDKFTLHMGEILKKFFYGNIISFDYSYDYADISNSGTINLPYSETNLDECYLGVRCRVAHDYVEEDFTDLKELPEVFLGFITDESFSSSQTKLGLSGMSKCLEKKYEFNFTQMQISKIMEEVIKTAGLEPVVDFTGLEDQVIDFSNASSSDDDSEDTDTSNVAIDTNIKTLATKICKGKKTAVKKAEAIWTWMHNNLNYEYYYNSHKSAVGVLQSGGGNCVDHAKLYYKLGAAAGLKVGFINTTCNGYGHVYNGININGTIYTADASVKSVGGFNQTWKACPKVTASNIRYDWSMWGD